ncbi:MAG: chemotaxis protein CheW [Xenococcaceae cyanobacterium MO_188.B19]|nr:chemotaxis protein CheW [Xenococcaceae cyanobacterium MO_188.B19]
MTTSSAASRIQADLQELFKADLAPGDAYIRFQLTSDMTALLSMKQVQESLIVETEKITTLPSMPESVIGIMSSRDRVFCVFDLAQFLALPSRLIAPRQYQIIVLQTTSKQPIYMGLAVYRLQGILRLPTAQILRSLESFPSNIAPYLEGVVQEEETMIPILEFNRISETLTKINNQ